jgi:hypothetical protein
LFTPLADGKAFRPGSGVISATGGTFPGLLCVYIHTDNQ